MFRSTFIYLASFCLERLFDCCYNGLIHQSYLFYFLMRTSQIEFKYSKIFKILARYFIFVVQNQVYGYGYRYGIDLWLWEVFRIRVMGRVIELWLLLWQRVRVMGRIRFRISIQGQPAASIVHQFFFRMRT